MGRAAAVAERLGCCGEPCRAQGSGWGGAGSRPAKHALRGIGRGAAGDGLGLAVGQRATGPRHRFEREPWWTHHTPPAAPACTRPSQLNPTPPSPNPLPPSPNPLPTLSQPSPNPLPPAPNPLPPSPNPLPTLSQPSLDPLPTSANPLPPSPSPAPTVSQCHVRLRSSAPLCSSAGDRVCPMGRRAGGLGAGG